MSAPKHLWSGDWEQESSAVSERTAVRRPQPRPTQPPPRPEPAARPPRRPQRRAIGWRVPARLRRILPVALAVILILAAGAYGLSRVTGGSDQSASTPAGQPSAPIRWLGMQLDSVNAGTVVIETVAPGSPAEQAGLNPGDVIAKVNGQAIDSTAQIGGAVASVRAGAYVPIQVNRGSTVVDTQALMTAPPSQHP
jgi:membrane-associated protease RseP (regulator of RpoE activity)